MENSETPKTNKAAVATYRGVFTGLAEKAESSDTVPELVGELFNSLSALLARLPEEVRKQLLDSFVIECEVKAKKLADLQAERAKRSPILIRRK